MDTSFKFKSEDLGFEVEGTESFVRSTMESFLPYVRAAGGTIPTSGAAPSSPRSEGPLATWYRKAVSGGKSPTMQDNILIFAHYLNREERRFIFVPDDMKAAFREIGREVPKSLLQILGSLRRDRGLLYSGQKRGEYSITPAGLRYVEELLDLPSSLPEPPPEARSAPRTAPDETPPEEGTGSPAAQLFRNIRPTTKGAAEDPE